MCSDALGISAVVTAMMGLCVLLLTGVLQWKECLGYPAAWDTLTWFAGERFFLLKPAIVVGRCCGAKRAVVGRC